MASELYTKAQALTVEKGILAESTNFNIRSEQDGSRPEDKWILAAEPVLAFSRRGGGRGQKAKGSIKDQVVKKELDGEAGCEEVEDPEWEFPGDAYVQLEEVQAEEENSKKVRARGGKGRHAAKQNTQLATFIADQVRYFQQVDEFELQAVEPGSDLSGELLVDSPLTGSVESSPGSSRPTLTSHSQGEREGAATDMHHHSHSPRPSQPQPTHTINTNPRPGVADEEVNISSQEDASAEEEPQAEEEDVKELGVSEGPEEVPCRSPGTCQVLNSTSRSSPWSQRSHGIASTLGLSRRRSSQLRQLPAGPNTRPSFPDTPVCRLSFGGIMPSSTSSSTSHPGLPCPPPPPPSAARTPLSQTTPCSLGLHHHASPAPHATPTPLSSTSHPSSSSQSTKLLDPATSSPPECTQTATDRIKLEDATGQCSEHEEVGLPAGCDPDRCTSLSPQHATLQEQSQNLLEEKIKSLTLSEDQKEEKPQEEELDALTLLLQECDQSIGEVPSLQKLLNQMGIKRGIRKIGEGTFGEAFKGCGTVLKIVPMAGDLLVNGEVQKTADDMRGEVVIAKAVSGLRDKSPQGGGSCTEGFIQLRRACVCRGKYAPVLLTAWKTWDRTHTSENDDPNMFPADQLYMVFVTEDGGQDLEHFTLRDFPEAKSLLLQATLALAVAEEELQFEHRDLHWGNLLIHRLEVQPEGPGEEFWQQHRLRGVDLQVKTAGVQVAIIDFTLSRLRAPHTGALAFYDLSQEPEIFEGTAGDCQMETYRRMKKATGDQWDEYRPATNSMWVHYLADTILSQKTFICSTQDRKSLQAFKRRALKCSSASELVWDTFFSGSWIANNSPSILSA